jgi:hypothetical protein
VCSLPVAAVVRRRERDESYALPQHRAPSNEQRATSNEQRANDVTQQPPRNRCDELEFPHSLVCTSAAVDATVARLTALAGAGRLDGNDGDK